MAAHCGGIDFIDLCLGRRISCRCSLSRLKADYLKGLVVIKARVKLQGRLGLGFHPQKPLGQFKLALGQASCAAIAVAQKESGYLGFLATFTAQKLGKYLHRGLLRKEQPLLILHLRMAGFSDSG